MKTRIVNVLFISCIFTYAMSGMAAVDDQFCAVERSTSGSLESTQERLRALAALHDCFIGANAVSQDNLLIDIRPPEVFERQGLPDVINIPSHHLQDKLFLHEKSVVLLGDAFDRVELVELCQQLKQQGFLQLHVLANAERAWSSSHLNRAVVLPQNAAEIADAGKLFAAYSKGYARLFYLDADMAARLRAQGFEGNLLTLQSNVHEQLLALMKTEGENGLLPVVLLGSDKAIATVQQSLLAQDVPGVYYMAEPERQIPQYLSERAAMLRARAQSQQQGACSAG